MIVDDFKYMLGGREVKSLKKSDVNLLKSVNIHNGPHGRAILLLHGFTSSPAVFREIIPALNNYDAIYCPILPGHAKSIESFAKATSKQWLDCSYNAYLSLAANYAKIDVLGLSLGGILALNLSQQFSINHLYLLAPALKLHTNAQFLLALAFFMKFLGIRKIRNRGGNLHCDKFQEIAYRQLPINSIIQLLTFLKSYTHVAPKCPTDLFVGRFDKVIDSSVVADMFINFSNVNIHWLENSAHVLPLDGDYQKIIDILQRNI